MTRRWVFLGLFVLILLLLAGGLITYLNVAPDRLADDFKKEAEPAHERAAKEMEDVFGSFQTVITGPGTSNAVERAKTPGQYAKAVRRNRDVLLRSLRVPRHEIADARRALRGAVGDAIDVPTAPLVGDSDQVEEARALSDQERRWVRVSRTYLREYDAILDYLVALLRWVSRTGITVTVDSARLPQNPGSPEEFAQPVDRMVERLNRSIRTFDRRRVPPALRRAHRASVRVFAFLAQKLRGLAAAVRAFDLARINELERELDTGFRDVIRPFATITKNLLFNSRPYRLRLRLRELEGDLREGYRQL